MCSVKLSAQVNLWGDSGTCMVSSGNPIHGSTALLTLLSGRPQAGTQLRPSSAPGRHGERILPNAGEVSHSTVRTIGNK